MQTTDANALHFEHMIRLVRVARGLEAGGYYNAAKLLWAELFSEEIRASNEQTLPIESNDLEREISIVIDALHKRGVKSEIITALEYGRQGVRENRTIPAAHIPRVHVCRICGEVMLGTLPQLCTNCNARSLTFREFLAVYFLEPLTPEQTIEALLSGPDEVEASVEGLNEEQMTQPPAEGEWSVREVLWHILTAQGLLAVRVERMLEEDRPSLKSVAAWTIKGEESLSTREIIGRYRDWRMSTVDRLQSMPHADWWRAARHDEFIEFTILQQASYFAKHERSHLPQIDAIRKVIEA